MRSTVETRNHPRRAGHNPSPHLGPPDPPSNRNALGGDPKRELVIKGDQRGEGPCPRFNAQWEGRDGSLPTLHPIPPGDADANVWASRG